MKELHPLGLQLQMAVGHHIGVWNRTWVLCRSLLTMGHCTSLFFIICPLRIFSWPLLSSLFVPPFGPFILAQVNCEKVLRSLVVFNYIPDKPILHKAPCVIHLRCKWDQATTITPPPPPAENYFKWHPVSYHIKFKFLNIACRIHVLCLPPGLPGYTFMGFLLWNPCSLHMPVFALVLPSILPCSPLPITFMNLIILDVPQLLYSLGHFLNSLCQPEFYV